MGTIIQATFLLVCIAFFVPFVNGVKAIIDAKLYIKNAKNILHKICLVFFVITALVLTMSIFLLSNFLKRISAGNYIMVLSYTLILAVISSRLASKLLYVNLNTQIDSFKTIFKLGYTKMASDFIIIHLPLNIILYVIYIFFLVVSQLFGLGIINSNTNFIQYCRLHEYGIVILIAIKELSKISFLKDDKPRIDLLDNYVEEDKKTEQI